MSTSSVLKKKIDKLLAEYHHVKLKLEEEESGLEELKKNLRAAKKAQSVLQEVAQQVQDQVHSQVDDVVTHCLQAIFGSEAYRFEIQFEQKRGRTEARPCFFDKAGNEVDIRDGTSGGAYDVASFALRVAVITLARLRRVLFLDEPFKHLSKEHREAARDLLLTLTQEMKFQFIMVTHSPELAGGKVIDVRTI